MQAPLPKEHLRAQTPQQQGSKDDRALKCILCPGISNLSLATVLLLGFRLLPSSIRRPLVSLSRPLAHSPITAASLQVCGCTSPAAVPPQGLCGCCFPCLGLFCQRPPFQRGLPCQLRLKPQLLAQRSPGPRVLSCRLSRCRFYLLACPVLPCELREGRHCCRLGSRLCLQCPAQNPTRIRRSNTAE